jgi:hypothetical protein
MYAATGIVLLCRWSPAEKDDTSGCIHIYTTYIIDLLKMSG